MEDKGIFAFIAKNIVSVLGVTVLTGATVTTSALGLAKVGKSMATTNLEVPQVRETTSSSPSLSSSSAAGARLNTTTRQTTSARPVGTTTKASVVQSTAVSTGATSSQAAASNTTSGCIVTLFGKQYDVTSLQNSHSGGNVFICGTDQTALYQSQHGTNMSRMQQYLVTSGGTSNTNTGGSTSSNTGSGGTTVNSGSSSSKNESEDHEKDEDHEEEREKEHEDRQETEHEDFESMINPVYRLIIS